MRDPYPLLRSLLFQLPPEMAHGLGLHSLRLSEACGLAGLLAGPPAPRPLTRMGLYFPNPLGVAAGLDKDGIAVRALFALGFGSVEVGTVTPRPQPGNPAPRLFRLKPHQALINRMGFNNAGMHALANRLEKLRRHPLPGVLGVNLGRNKSTSNEDAASDYLAGMDFLYPLADYLAVNISSPNTPGLRELQAASALRALLEPLKEAQSRLATRHARYVPLVLKVAPDLEAAEIQEISELLLQLELDGLIATNTTRSRTEVAGHAHAAEEGGLSGRPLEARSLDVLHQFSRQLEGRICLIAAGGLHDAAGARARLDAGADLLQVYTAFIYQGPALVRRILADL
ncbi:MAG: quinone-dependent dihydroorotate dehydrogenase [Calditrichaeota bacterium]|nr:quinone-dependent dihydroorotate dehydrogenase [Calditrichota bacterium]